MNQDVYQFSFDETVNVEDAQGTFMLALVALESLHGKAAVRLDCRFRSDPAAKLFHINSGSAIGNDLAKLFTGFAIHAYGYDAVRIRRGQGRADNSGAVLQ
jgi:hypothetical protein